MESNDIFREFADLPPNAQALAADFITFLKQRYQQLPSPAAQEQQDWRDEPFIGIWQDREDLQDSTQWVRSTRSSEWRS